MSNINYPDVPPLPGVPALNRAGNQALAAGLTIAAELYALYLKIKNTPPIYPKQAAQYAIWGILYADDKTINGQIDYSITQNTNSINGYTSTKATIKGHYALKPDSFVKFEYKKDNKIPNYPVEQGGFQSYNKVALPYEIKLTITKGGLGNNSYSVLPFMEKIQTLLSSTDILTIVTPERIYGTTNLIHFDYRKEARNGAVLLIAELTFQEVRILPTPADPTATPQSATDKNNGQVAPVIIGSATPKFNLQ